MNTTIMNFIETKALEAYDGVAVIGSYAIGNERKWSDIDLIVVSKENKDEVHLFEKKYVSVKYLTQMSLNDYFIAIDQKQYLPSFSQMKIIYDPKGILNDMKEKSSKMIFSNVDKEHGRHLAKESYIGYMEEAQKALQGLIDAHNGKMLAGLYGLTYGMFDVIAKKEALGCRSDNDFYDDVMNHLDEKNPIKSIAPIAFGIKEANLIDRVEAGLEMFIHVGNDLLIDMKENEKVYVIHLIHEIIKTI